MIILKMTKAGDLSSKLFYRQWSVRYYFNILEIGYCIDEQRMLVASSHISVLLTVLTSLKYKAFFALTWNEKLNAFLCLLFKLTPTGQHPAFCVLQKGHMAMLQPTNPSICVNMCSCKWDDQERIVLQADVCVNI